MAIFTKISKGLTVCLLLLSMVMGPTTATAAEGLIAELVALTQKVDAIEQVLKNSYDLTTEQRASFTKALDAIDDEIALLTAIETTGTAMEVVLLDGPAASVEVVTADAIEKLRISFGSDFATSTDTQLVAEAVRYTAQKYGLNQSTLESGVKKVTAFSGITLPESLFGTASNGELVPADTDEVIAAVRGRKNIENIIITGSVPDYKITAQVIYGAEADFEQATITRRYNFDAPRSANTMAKELKDIVQQASEKIGEEFGLIPSAVVGNATISIERYERAVDVPPAKGYSFDDMEELSKSEIIYFGRYSIVDDIAIVTNDITGDSKSGFSIVFRTDQAEEIRFVVRPEYGERRDEEYKTGRYTYGFTFTIHDEVVAGVSQSGVSYTELSNYLKEYYAGIGKELGVNEAQYINDLTAFLSRNEAVYRVHSKTYQDATWTPEGASTCYTDKTREAVIGAINYMLEGMQFIDELEEFVNIYPQVSFNIDREKTTDTVSRGCIGLEEYFPSYQ